MKNQYLIFIIIFCTTPLICISQKNNIAVPENSINNKQVSNIIHNKNKLSQIHQVKSFHVEENINMKFGGHTTTYNVSKKNMVQNYDLGPNNKRIVTESTREVIQYFEDTLTIKFKPISITKAISKTDITIPSTEKKEPLVLIESKIQELKPIPIDHKTEIEPIKDVEGDQFSAEYLYVYAIKTYKAIAEKGYKSVDIFKKLGNYYFFKSEMQNAVRWYSELFEMTQELEPEFFYRYGYSLKATGEKSKSKEILEKYNQMTSKIN